MKTSSVNIFLLFLGFLIIILSFPKGGELIFHLNLGRSEINIVELTQAGLLLYGLFLTIKSRKMVFKVFNKFSFILRSFMFLFLFYEEISFVTKGKFAFTESFNSVNQLNIHNALLGRELVLENINLPFLGYTFNITLYVLCITLFSLFIGFGAYVKPLKRIKFLFVEKELSLFLLIFPLNIVLSSILSKFNIINANTFVVPELVETYIYLVLCIDVLYKQKKMRAFLNNNL